MMVMWLQKSIFFNKARVLLILFIAVVTCVLLTFIANDQHFITIASQFLFASISGDHGRDNTTPMTNLKLDCSLSNAFQNINETDVHVEKSDEKYSPKKNPFTLQHHSTRHVEKVKSLKTGLQDAHCKFDEKSMSTLMKRLKTFLHVDSAKDHDVNKWCPQSLTFTLQSRGEHVDILTKALQGVPVLKPIPKMQISCPRQVVPTRVQLPKTALLSFPGSGNTWTRHLIQQLTGFETGAVYFAKSLIKDGFPGEGKKENVVVIKTHSISVPGTEMFHFDKTIFVVRNPYFANAAEYKRGPLKLDHQKAGHIDGNSQEWKKHINHWMPYWFKLIRHALKSPTHPMLIVFYEDLQSGLLLELLRIGQFLKTSGLEEFSICCALSNNEGKNHRQQAPVDLYSLYDKTTRSWVNKMIKELAKELENRLPIFSQRILDYVLN